MLIDFSWAKLSGCTDTEHRQVAVSEATIETMRKRKDAGQSLWRISSTCFGHVASDQVLRPLGKFDTDEARGRYPPITAGDMMQEELKAINLAA